jgi:hypothetical protein
MQHWLNSFLTARESLKQSVRQNKLGLSEAEYQQTQLQKPIVTAVQQLGEKISKTQDAAAASAIQKLTEKQENDAASGNVDDAASEFDAASERKQMSAMAGEIDEEAEMERIASFSEEMASNRMTSKRYKSGIMTVDSDNRLGDLPVQLDFDRKVVSVGDRESKLSLPLLELLYAPTPAVSARVYDQETIREYERLT